MLDTTANRSRPCVAVYHILAHRVSYAGKHYKPFSRTIQQILPQDLTAFSVAAFTLQREYAVSGPVPMPPRSPGARCIEAASMRGVNPNLPMWNHARHPPINHSNTEKNQRDEEGGRDIQQSVPQTPPAPARATVYGHTRNGPSNLHDDAAICQDEKSYRKPPPFSNEI